MSAWFHCRAATASLWGSTGRGGDGGRTDPPTGAADGLWADWLTATHVLDDGLNPAARPLRRTARHPHSSAHDIPGATA